MRTLFLGRLLLGSGAAGDAPLSEGKMDGPAALRKRFLDLAERIRKENPADKKLVAACLVHGGDEKAALGILELEGNRRKKDIPLWVASYRLACKVKKESSNEPLGKLIEMEITVRPFDWITESRRARAFIETERLLAKHGFRKAIEYDPLEPSSYFDLGMLMLDREEAFALFADALLLANPGSELSSRVVDAVDEWLRPAKKP